MVVHVHNYLQCLGRLGTSGEWLFGQHVNEKQQENCLTGALKCMAPLAQGLIKSTVTTTSSVETRSNLHKISQIAGHSMPHTQYDTSNHFLKCSHLLIGQLI